MTRVLYVIACAAHPAFAENIARLRSWGVTVLTRTQLDEGPGQPGFPWARALASYCQDLWIKIV